MDWLIWLFTMDMLVCVEGPLNVNPSTFGMDGAVPPCVPCTEIVSVTDSPKEILFRSTEAVTDTSANAVAAQEQIDASRHATWIIAYRKLGADCLMLTSFVSPIFGRRP